MEQPTITQIVIDVSPDEGLLNFGDTQRFIFGLGSDSKVYYWDIGTAAWVLAQRA